MTGETPLLPVAEPDLGPLEEQMLLDAFRSGWISSIGSYVRRFESEFALFTGARHAIAVSNGTTALDLALLAGGVKPGDEVIVPALTFVAPVACIRHVGATPVFVDSEPTIGTLDPRAVARAVTERTRAIIAVHLYGHPADMDPLLSIAKDRNLLVVEDAAEAHGACYRGRPVGSIGHIGTFSFYGNKLLTTGEGGMVTTSDERFAERIRFLKDHAMSPSRRYWHTEVGFNYRMTNLQAAIGCAQLARIREVTSKRYNVVELYRKSFAGTPVLVNPSREWARCVPWLACAVLPETPLGSTRDQVMRSLRDAGFDSRPYFYLASEMPPYSRFPRINADGGEALDIAMRLSLRGLNLPTTPRLTEQNATEIARIVTTACPR